jgi:hypothetical protein
MPSLQDRMIGAMRVQASTFEEVEHDAAATSQAAVVVLIAAVAAAIGGISWAYFRPVAIVLAIVLALIGWAISAAVLWLVGTRLFPGPKTEADFGQLLRVSGFAQAPGVFSVLGLIPIIGLLIRFLVSIWTLVALIVGVRQALDYEDTLKAVIVCVVAWVIELVVVLGATMLGVGGAAVGAGLMGR